MSATEKKSNPLRVLNTLKDELKASTKRRMDRIPDNVAWTRRPLTLISTSREPGQHPVEIGTEALAQTSAQRTSSARNPLLIMQTPTTAELRTAIQVLDKLGERLTAHANHSMIEMPETQLGNHYAGQIEANAIEQTARIKLVSAQLKTWRDELLQQRQTVSHHV